MSISSRKASRASNDSGYFRTAYLIRSSSAGAVIVHDKQPRQCLRARNLFFPDGFYSPDFSIANIGISSEKWLASEERPRVFSGRINYFLCFPDKLLDNPDKRRLDYLYIFFIGHVTVKQVRSKEKFSFCFLTPSSRQFRLSHQNKRNSVYFIAE